VIRDRRNSAVRGAAAGPTKGAFALTARAHEAGLDRRPSRHWLLVTTRQVVVPILGDVPPGSARGVQGGERATVKTGEALRMDVFRCDVVGRKASWGLKGRRPGHEGFDTLGQRLGFLEFAPSAHSAWGCADLDGSADAASPRACPNRGGGSVTTQW
jgi:hypothetical protein